MALGDDALAERGRLVQFTHLRRRQVRVTRQTLAKKRPLRGAAAADVKQRRIRRRIRRVAPSASPPPSAAEPRAPQIARSVARVPLELGQSALKVPVSIGQAAVRVPWAVVSAAAKPATADGKGSRPSVND